MFWISCEFVEPGENINYINLLCNVFTVGYNKQVFSPELWKNLAKTRDAVYEKNLKTA